MNKRLNSYIGLVDFLADFLGTDAEVVLHDMTDLENSVIAIRNNHISGRQVGAPATDLVLKILKNKKYDNYNYLSNYKGTSQLGKPLKSATFFIRNEKNKIEGMLCINMDVEKMSQVKDYIEQLLGFKEEQDNNDPISETLSQSAQELTLGSIQKVVDSFSIPPERMDQDEKIAIIRELSEKGVFLIKGAVGQAAQALKVSEPTIYRYLGKLKKN